MLAPLCSEGVGVHEHFQLSLTNLLVTDRVLGVLAPDHPVAPPEHLMPIFHGYPEQLGDHLERQLRGDIDHEVALAPLDRAVEDRYGDFADVRAERANHARGKSLIDQRAIASMVR